MMELYNEYMFDLNSYFFNLNQLGISAKSVVPVHAHCTQW